MCKLIVHADDFGLSEKVNEGIWRAHTRGILTSASIMANGAAFDHAVSICQATPTLDIGIHLTLVEERPVIGAAKVPSLVNSEGRFHHHASEFSKRYLIGKISFQEVQRELSAQIAKVTSHGIKVTHLNSHQHLHTLPKILRIAVELARKYGIPAVRVPSGKLHISMLWKSGSITRVIHSLVLKFLCGLGDYADLLRSDYFFGFLFSGNLNKENLRKILRHLPSSGTCEVMCHPGLDDPDSHYGHWKYRWQDELEALTDRELPGLLEKMGITLISYRDLAG